MMPTREEIAAFADGELDPARAAEIAALAESDPGIARQVAAHHALKMRLAAHYDPILEETPPERLTAMLRPNAPQIIDFAGERERRARRRSLPRWSYFAAPAIAAALALAVFVPGGSGGPGSGYADARLASALDSQLSADQPVGSPARVLISFQNANGQFCRAFSGAAASGIACRDQKGWRLEDLGHGNAASDRDYRQAGSDNAELMAEAQDMAVGPALDAAAERAARTQGWQPGR